jgi:O-acetylhomoserine/O-acetylserine sulfhydrylase-like pyridoxal-dependent enzyme
MYCFLLPFCYLFTQRPSFCRNAFAIALFLEQHRGVTKTLYPGLPSHPQHELAKQQQHGFGAMITFYCVGGKDQAAVFLKNVSYEERIYFRLEDVLLILMLSISTCS